MVLKQFTCFVNILHQWPKAIDVGEILLSGSFKQAAT
jgi:hypothetical protein